jgi:DNA excision repair protein ERCC-4
MRAMALPTDPKPSMLTAIIDTRENQPLDLNPLKTTVATLTTGDYSIRGLESVISIERKSLSDLLSCVGTDRQRFDREVMRLKAYPCRALVIEATWAELESGDWRSKVTPQAVVGSCLGWIGAGLPVALVGDHERAGRFVSRLLFISARRRWREARSLVIGTTGDSP